MKQKSLDKMSERRNMFSNQKELILKPKFLFILAFFILARIYLANVGSLYSIIVINDEFGYWGTAAQLTGKNWSELLAMTPYYSYGYSVLLIPLFWLNLSPSTMYTVAIIFNAIFALGSFYISIKCCERLFPKVSVNYAILNCFAVACYSNTVFQTQIAWPETLLYFLYWILLWFLIQMVKTKEAQYILAVLIVSICLYGIHQRTVGILLCVVLLSVFWTIQTKLKRKTIFNIILISSMFMILHMFMKNYVTTHIFISEEMVSANSYSGQYKKIISILTTWDGFYNFLQGVCGKLFYLGAGTLLFAFFGFAFLMNKNLQILKTALNKRKVIFEDNDYIWFFCFLSFMSMFVINAIAMNYAVGRLDILIYGRYMEVAIGPLLLFGLIHLGTVDKKWKMVAVCGIVLGMLSVIVDKVLIAMNTTNFNIYTATALNKFFSQNDNIKYLTFYISLLVLITMLFLVLINERKSMTKLKKYTCVFSILSVAAMWTYLADTSIIARTHVNNDDVIRPLVDFIEPVEEIREIYFVDYAEDKTGFKEHIKYIQYYLPNKTIKLIQHEDLQDHLSAQACYITTSNSQIKSFMKRDLDEILTTNWFSLMILPNTKMDEVLHMQSVSVMDKMQVSGHKIGKNGVISDKISSYFVFGPYISLSAGTYEVTFELESISQLNNVGLCDIVADVGTVILQEVRVTSDHLKYNKLTIPFSLKKDTDNIEFRVLNYDGVQLQVNGISYTKVEDKYQLGLNLPEETKVLKNILDEGDSISKVVCLNDVKTPVSIKYLEQELDEFEVELRIVKDMIGKTESAYILVPNDNLDWMLLLDDYILVEEFEEYKLFAPENSKREYSYNHALSEDNQISFSVFQSKEDGGYISNSYSDIPGGEYNIYLKVEGDLAANSVESFKIYISCGTQLLEAIDVPAASVIKIPLVTEETLNKVSFRAYTDEGDELFCFPYKIEVVNNKYDYIWSPHFEQILDKLKDLKLDATLIEDASIMNHVEIEKYFMLNNIVNVDVVGVFFDLENWKTLIEKNKAVILPIKMELVWPLLDDGYVIVARTDKYVLLCNENAGISSTFSKDSKIFADFFMKQTGQQNINLPEGVFEIVFDITFNNLKFFEESYGKVLLYSGNRIISSYELTPETKEISTFVSGVNGISNLRIEVLEDQKGTVRGELRSIEKIGEGYLVDLKDMQITDSILPSEEGTINIFSLIPITIYGPYCTLKPGNYEVRFEYKAKSDKDIVFDINVKGGGIISRGDSTMAQINEIGRSEVIVPIQSLEDLYDVEFRAHIPKNADFTLFSIILVPVE